MVTNINKTFGPGGPRAKLALELSRRGGLLLMIFLLPVILGAWRDFQGNTINPRYVARIQDGKTTKHEILLLFGDPQDVDRNPEGAVFKYKSYKDAPPPRSTEIFKEPDEQSATPFVIDENKKIKKKKVKKEGKILKATLIIRFKPDGETVMSHEYKEF